MQPSPFISNGRCLYLLFTGQCTWYKQKLEILKACEKPVFGAHRIVRTWYVLKLFRAYQVYTELEYRFSCGCIPHVLYKLTANM